MHQLQLNNAGCQGPSMLFVVGSNKSAGVGNMHNGVAIKVNSSKMASARGCTPVLNIGERSNNDLKDLHHVLPSVDSTSSTLPSDQER